MITRLEIIDHTEDTMLSATMLGEGRNVITSPEDGKKITYDIQDDGRTLKVFIQ